MEEKDRFKKSQEAEKKRYRFEMKYSKPLPALVGYNSL